MFQDQRSRKIILVAHCILNQNAKMDKTAFYPGAATSVAELLVHSGVGIIQMPCPELCCLGLDRGVTAEEAAQPFEKGNTRVVEWMKRDEVSACCWKLAESVINQVQEYLKHGFKIAGLIGVSRSPSCGVGTTWGDDREIPGTGAFIRTLQEGLAQMDVTIPMVGIKVQDPEKAGKSVQSILDGIE